MSTNKIDPKNEGTKISSTDDLTKTTNKSDVELSEEELKRVSGGGKLVDKASPVLMQACATGAHLKVADI
jgi:type VI protein secretion system component Hcp